MAAIREWIAPRAALWADLLTPGDIRPRPLLQIIPLPDDPLQDGCGPGEWRSPAHPEQLSVWQVSISAFPIKQWWGKGAEPSRPCVEPMNRSRCTFAGTESLRS